MASGASRMSITPCPLPTESVLERLSMTTGRALEQAITFNGAAPAGWACSISRLPPVADTDLRSRASSLHHRVTVAARVAS